MDNNIAKLLRDVLTPAEAAERWGLSPNTIRSALADGRFDSQIQRGLVRRSGNVWLLHINAMREVFGPPPGEEPIEETKPTNQQLEEALEWVKAEGIMDEPNDHYVTKKELALILFRALIESEPSPEQ